MSETTLSKPGLDLPQQTPGSMLRQLREEQGLSHNNVSEALRLTVHYIKALENDEYGKLPGLTFVKGYLRSYSSLVKADVNAVMKCYDKYIATMEDDKGRTDDVQRSRRRHDQALRWAVVATLIVVAGIAGGWWFLGQDQAPQPRALSLQQAPASQGAAARAATTSPSTSMPAPPAGATAAPADVGTGAGPAVTVAPYAASAPAGSVPLPAGAVPMGAATNGLTASISTEGATTSVLPAAGATLPGAIQPYPAPPADAALPGALQPATTPGASAAMPGTIEPAAALAGTAVSAAPPASAAGLANAGGTAPSPGATGAAMPAVSGATAAVTAAPTAASPAAPAEALTITPVANGTRQVNLVSAGEDLLQLSFTGNSWVEVDDGRDVRLYNDMLRTGDVFTIRGTAPFRLLFGDGNNVEVTFNSTAVDIGADIRADRTARVVLPAAAPITAAGATP